MEEDLASVGIASKLPRPHGQFLLGSVQHLDLCLLVDAEHHLSACAAVNSGFGAWLSRLQLVMETLEGQRT